MRDSSRAWWTLLGTSSLAGVGSGFWIESVARVLDALQQGAPEFAWPLKRTVSDPEACRTSSRLQRHRAYLITHVSIWFSNPNATVIASTTRDDETIQMIDLLHDGHLGWGGCLEAIVALSLFASLVRNDSYADAGFFPGSPIIEWHQAAESDWPILALATQVQRLQADPFVATTTHACDLFVESTLAQPLGSEGSWLPALQFLGTHFSNETRCHVATALGLAVVIQGAPRDLALRGTGIVAAFLASTENPPAAALSAIFYLLDRVLACPGHVRFRSKMGHRFSLHVFPRRETHSDGIRLHGDGHCSLETYFRISIEEKVKELLLSKAGRITIAEVGPAFGQCIVPALLLDKRVSGILIEPSRNLRQLLAKTLADNRIDSRVRVVPAFVTSGSSEQHVVDVAHKEFQSFVTPGEHVYVKGAVYAGAAPTSAAATMHLFGSAVYERETARAMSLPAALGTLYVDLLLLFPWTLCVAIHKALDESIRCARTVAIREDMVAKTYVSDIGPGCIFADCTITSA
eukprot:TRINITY_DN65851_c0_g1_i1.p1 TRINITY_DN65851_c0_g1~~TRINITY_DN65851_c0_g1_i1.p1  ORF type:complete len:519 (+),score=42.92 TRINITY_DN65851_c0_g1_i1:81-1637(+)